MGCDDNYLPATVYPEGYSGGISVTNTCTRCWAQVAYSHVERHDEWHVSLGRTAQQADYADAMTRPIGGPPSRGWAGQ